MDETRKRAYRYLLYTALLDIRANTWFSVGPGWWHPRFLRRALHSLRRSNIVADCFHNLAHFAALDFENFDEAWFWRDLAHLDARYPSLGIARTYKAEFERELSQPAHSAAWAKTD
jgi:hypothetical protein